MCQPRWRGAAAGLLSFSFGIQERGAGEQAEMRGEERRGDERGSGVSWWSLGKLSSSVKEHELLSPLPTLGVGESWFLFLVFSVSITNSWALGPGRLLRPSPRSQELQEGPCVGQGPRGSHLGQSWGHRRSPGCRMST